MTNSKPVTVTLPRVSELMPRIENHDLDVATIGAALMNWYLDALRRFGHDIIEAEDYAEILQIHTRVMERCERKPLANFNFTSKTPNKAEAS